MKIVRDAVPSEADFLDEYTLRLALIYMLSLWGKHHDEEECLKNLKLFNQNVWDQYYKGDADEQTSKQSEEEAEGEESEQDEKIDISIPVEE